jgi:hypothetical protein
LWSGGTIPNRFAKYYHSTQNPDHAKTGVTVQNMQSNGTSIKYVAIQAVQFMNGGQYWMSFGQFSGSTGQTNYCHRYSQQLDISFGSAHSISTVISEIM